MQLWEGNSWPGGATEKAVSLAVLSWGPRQSCVALSEGGGVSGGLLPHCLAGELPTFRLSRNSRSIFLMRPWLTKTYSNTVCYMRKIGMKSCPTKTSFLALSQIRPQATVAKGLALLCNTHTRSLDCHVSYCSFLKAIRISWTSVESSRGTRKKKTCEHQIMNIKMVNWYRVSLWKAMHSSSYAKAISI